jgi:hypothetical protein
VALRREDRNWLKDDEFPNEQGVLMAALSQAQAEVTKEAQRAGIEHAKTRDGLCEGESAV